MKSHAVPQEIMSMEFKLFGNFMTLREFIFVASGIALAWFFYILKNTGVLPPILAWPAIITFGVGGAIFGLLPLQDRTIDQWILNFILAIRKPTLRIWKKPGFEPITKEDKEIVSLKGRLVPPVKPKASHSTKKIVSAQEKVTDEQAEKQVQASLSRIDNTISQVERGLQSVPRRPKPVQTPAPQPVQQIKARPMVYKRKMITKGSVNLIEPQISKQGTKPKPTLKQPTVIPTAQPVQPVKTSKKVIELNDSTFQKYASPEEIPNLQKHPNTLNMIVKDKEGKIVEGVVCVIKNPEGSPIRAAVSNDFGQIINNNPLDNGKYKVTLSKEGMGFPELSMDLSGKNYPILEITAQ